MCFKTIVAAVILVMVTKSYAVHHDLWGNIDNYSSLENEDLPKTVTPLEEENTHELDVLFPLKEKINNCTNAGISCKDCNMAIVCYPEHGRLVSVYLEKCAAGHTCHEGIGCSPNPNSRCPPNYFACKVTGTFPDPFDCTLYHTCVHPDNSSTALKLHTEKCADNYSYNPKTTLCDTPSHMACKYKAPSCEHAGDTSELYSDDPRSYFYICQFVKNEAANVNILYPFMYRCEHGEIFSNQNCVLQLEGPSHLHPLNGY